MAEVSLMVNGINCGGCKKPLEAKLMGLDGVAECEIVTKSESGVHPNKVVVTAEERAGRERWQRVGWRRGEGGGGRIGVRRCR